MAKDKEVTLKVKVSPEIDLSSIDDKVLDALADKVAERLDKPSEIHITYQNNTPPTLPPQPRLWPGQVWC